MLTRELCIFIILLTLSCLFYSNSCIVLDKYNYAFNTVPADAQTSNKNSAVGRFVEPHWNLLLQIIIDGLGRVLRVSRTKPDVRKTTGNDDDVDGDGDASGTTNSTWLTMARILDRFFFLVYCLTYIIMAIAFAAVRL